MKSRLLSMVHWFLTDLVFPDDASVSTLLATVFDLYYPDFKNHWSAPKAWWSLSLYLDLSIPFPSRLYPLGLSSSTTPFLDIPPKQSFISASAGTVLLASFSAHLLMSSISTGTNHLCCHCYNISSMNGWGNKWEVSGNWGFTVFVPYLCDIGQVTLPLSLCVIF